MFIKIPIYFELTGQFNPEEVRILSENWQRELTKQIANELKSWNKFKFEMTGKPSLLELKTSESVRRNIVKPDLSPSSEKK
jgi:hypothetical protein